MYKLASFRIADAEKTGDPENRLEDFLGALINRGQIVGGGVLEAKDGEYLATVSVPEADALDKRYWSEYARRWAQGLQIDWEIVGDDAFSSAPCACPRPSRYLLSVSMYEESSPVICGDCGREVPLYKIPATHEAGDHAQLVSWQRTHQAVERLWMESLSDRFTGRQLESPTSELNVRGKQFARRIEEGTGTPAYLYLENPLRRLKNRPSLSACPACKASLEKRDFGGTMRSVCEKCRLAVDAAE